MFGDEIDRITEVDILTGEILAERDEVGVYPASHYVTTRERIERAAQTIEEELEGRLAELRSSQAPEAQRLEQRTSRY